MYLIDTNIHAVYLLQNFQDDEVTKQYLAMYNTIPVANRIVPDFILGEFETFMLQVVPSRYTLPLEDKQKLKQLVLEYLHRLTQECMLTAPDTKTVQIAMEIYLKNAQSHYISFIDALVLATAKQHEYIILTKDQRLVSRAKELHIDYYEPER